MTGWREHAAAGQWQKIELYRLDTDELTELAAMLRNIVPRATRGHGTEEYEGHIRPEDAVCLESYYAAQILEAVQRRLEELDRCDCVSEAAEYAKNFVRRCGMDFEGWRDTYLYWNPHRRAWQQIPSADAIAIIEHRENELSRLSELSLEDFIAGYKALELEKKPWRNCQPLHSLFQRDAFERFTPLWHALNILNWDDALPEYLLENCIDAALEAAFQIGSSYTTLIDKPNQRHAVRGKEVVRAARKGGDARRGALGPETAQILQEMARLTNSGRNIKEAAEALTRKGIGKSAGANRGLWYRHRPKNV